MFNLDFFGKRREEEPKQEKKPEQIIDEINAKVADILGAKGIFPGDDSFQEELNKATEQALKELKTTDRSN